MKLISIGAWNGQTGGCTILTRHYDNTDNKGTQHIVSLDTDGVSTYLFKDNIHQIIKTGIHHLTRPRPL